MSSTSLRILAPRDLVCSIQWTGSNAAYGLLKHWARTAVERGSDGELYLQTEHGVEPVPIGNHIILIDGYFQNFTPAKREDKYVEINQNS